MALDAGTRPPDYGVVESERRSEMHSVRLVVSSLVLLSGASPLVSQEPQEPMATERSAARIPWFAVPVKHRHAQIGDFHLFPPHVYDSVRRN